MKPTNTAYLFPLLLISLLIPFNSCEDANIGDPQNDLSSLEGILIFPQAGEIFSYDLPSQKITFLADRKGRQGPFFSPEGSFFTTNNWPGNNEGVAVWETDNAAITREFDLESTLTSEDKGVKVAPGALLFSGVINTPAGENPDLVIMDDQGSIKWRVDGDGMRIKGHVWDRQENLFFTGEVLQGANAGVLFLARVADFADPKIKIIRTFSGEYRNLPDEIAISADGNRVSYSYETNIWIGSTAEGATDHRLHFEAVQTLARPCFSPDGNYLAMVMLNSSAASRGDIHIAKIPAEGTTTLAPEGTSKLPGPNSSSNSTWSSGEDSAIGWFR